MIMDPFEKEYDQLRQFLEQSEQTQLLESLDNMRDLYHSVCDELSVLEAHQSNY